MQTFIGIFWIKKFSRKWQIVESFKVADCANNAEIIETSVSRDIKTGHYEYWERCGHSKNYEEVPRGRVLFNKFDDVYFVIAGNYAFSDKNCTKPFSSFKKILLSEFELPENTKFIHDEHYDL